MKKLKKNKNKEKIKEKNRSQNKPASHGIIRPLFAEDGE